ncbi:uncharacterized protein METZ01_LOCUS477980, partial [marine metagenome]
WIALLLYTKTLDAQILQEFSSEKTCWEHYTGDQSFGKQLNDHQNKPITKDYHFKKQGAEYPIRLFVVPETKELLWLTCELQASLDYSKRKYPLNIILPTPA